MEKSSKTIRQYIDTDNYIIGIDPGVASLGMAAVNPDYSPIRLISKTFEKAINDSDRRAHRSARRTHSRKLQKQNFLIGLFSKRSDILKRDPQFFKYIKAGAMNKNEKFEKFGYVPFYSTAEFNNRFPTYYHLIRDLVSGNVRDVSLEHYYLALSYMFKTTGNTYMNISGEDDSLESIYKNTQEYCKQELGVKFKIKDLKKFYKIVGSKSLKPGEKKKILFDKEDPIIEINDGNKINNIDYKSLFTLFSLSTPKISSIFKDFKDIDSVINFKSFSNKEEEYKFLLGEDNVSILNKLHCLYNSAVSTYFLRGCNSVYEAKIREYEENKAKVDEIACFIKEKDEELYKKYFAATNSHSAELYQSLISEERIKENTDLIPEKVKTFINEVSNGEFLYKLKHSGNSVFCNSIRLGDLNKLLEAGERDFSDFFNSIYEDGYSVSECIRKAFTFHIPYMVGPLNPNSPYSWIVRKEPGKIKYWNFEDKVDLEKTAENFITNLVGKCPYTGKTVLPKNSLIYSEFMLLNQLNCLKINDKNINSEVKNAILDNFFYKKPVAVSKESLVKFLVKNKYMTEFDILSGINKNIPTVLRSYFDFKPFLDKGIFLDTIEDIILKNTIHGKSKDIFKSYLEKTYPEFNEDDIRIILSKNYEGWGTLSKEYLTEIYSPDKNGEALNIMDYLRKTSNNLSQLQSDKFKFTENAEKIYGDKVKITGNFLDFCKSNYYNNAVKKSLNQIENSLNKFLSHRKLAPNKIFVELPRFGSDIKEETESRLKQLKTIYNNKKNGISSYLIDMLNKETVESLRNNRIFFWYCQLGKDIYTGEDIEYSSITHNQIYDIDHIKPRSLFKGSGDDSLDNKVLCSSNFNQQTKKNIYPLPASVRDNMKAFWLKLLNLGLISNIKFENLIRSYPLTENEINGFISSDLPNTSALARGVVKMLEYKFPNSEIRTISAARILDFKKEYDIVKIRELNIYHHAKDAYLAAVVGNVFYECITKKIESHKLPKDSSDYTLNIFRVNTEGVWNKDSSLKIILKTISSNDINYSLVPKTASTSFYDIKPLPPKRARMPLKENLPVERFGGYSNINACYACIVETTVKSERVKMIHPVPIMYKKEFERNSVEYFKKRTDFVNPVLVYYPIRRGDIIKLDGVKYYYKGTTAGRVNIIPKFEFFFKDREERFLNSVIKFNKSFTKEMNKDNSERIKNAANNITHPETDERFLSACERKFRYGNFLFLTNIKIQSQKDIDDKMKERILDAVNTEVDMFMNALMKKMQTKYTSYYFENIVKKFRTNRNAFKKLNVFDKLIVINDFLPVINYSVPYIQKNILFSEASCVKCFRTVVRNDVSIVS